MLTVVVKAKSVLLVEDDRALRELYRSALRQAGYEVGAVEDGTDELWRIDHWTPDIVVLDLGLPRLSGRDLRYELKARPDTPNIPIVIVSGTDTSDLDPNQFASILPKPIQPEALVRSVDNALRTVRHAEVKES